MKVLRAIYSIIRTIVTIILICLLAIILTQRFSNNKMSVAGIRIFTVVTESMVPDYLIGDAILVRSVDPEELSVGDDITYLGQKDSFQDKIVTHRIIKKEKNNDGTYTIGTKGIANEEKDPEINETQVYGKVIYKIKSISYLNGIIGNLYGMYFLIIVPMALMVFFEFIGHQKDKEREEEKDKKDNKDEIKEENKKTDVDEEQERKEKRKKRRSKRREKRRKKKDKEL